MTDPTTPGGLGSRPGTLTFDVAWPDHLSRWLPLVKWILAIPHFVVLYVLGIAFAVVTVIAFFAILVTGRYPRGLWHFAMAYQRWTQHVAAYVLLMRDEYPPFGTEPYPVRFDIGYPERFSRLLIFVKWLLVLPHILVLAVLGVVAFLALVVAFIAIIVTGRFPRDLFDLVTGVMRWSLRVNLYSSLLTDVYPPFSLR